MTRVVVATLAVALAGLSTRVHADIPPSVAPTDVLLNAVFDTSYSAADLGSWNCTSLDPFEPPAAAVSCAGLNGGGRFGWVGGQGTFGATGEPLCGGAFRTSICNSYEPSQVEQPTMGPAYSPRLPSGTRHQLQFQVSIAWGGSTCTDINVIDSLYVRGATAVDGPLTVTPPVTSTGAPDPAGTPGSYNYQQFSFEIDTSGVDEIVVGVTRNLAGCSVFFKDVRVWFVTTVSPSLSPTPTPTTPQPSLSPTSSAPSPEPTFAPTTTGFQYADAPQMVVTFGGDLGGMDAAGQTVFGNGLRSAVIAASTTITASDIAGVVLAAGSTAAGATITATVSFVPNTVTTRDVDEFANTVTATDIEIEVNGVRYSTQGQAPVSLFTDAGAGAYPSEESGAIDPADVLVGVIVALAALLIGVTLLFIRYRSRVQRQQAETKEWTQERRKGAHPRGSPMVPNPTFANRTYAEIEEAGVSGLPNHAEIDEAGVSRLPTADDRGASRSKPQHQANAMYNSAEDTAEGSVQQGRSKPAAAYDRLDGLQCAGLQGSHKTYGSQEAVGDVDAENRHTSPMYESATGDANAAPPSSPHTALGTGGGYADARASGLAHKSNAMYAPGNSKANDPVMSTA